MYFLLIATCPLNTPHIPSSYSNEQTTKETNAINNSYIYIYISHVNVPQTVPDISPLMPMHQDPLLVSSVTQIFLHHLTLAGACPTTRFGAFLIPSVTQSFPHHLTPAGACPTTRLGAFLITSVTQSFSHRLARSPPHNRIRSLPHNITRYFLTTWSGVHPILLRLFYLHFLNGAFGVFTHIHWSCLLH